MPFWPQLSAFSASEERIINPYNKASGLQIPKSSQELLLFLKLAAEVPYGHDKMGFYSQNLLLFFTKAPRNFPFRICNLA